MKKSVLWLLPLFLMACNEPVAHQPTASAASNTVASAHTVASVSFDIPANARTPASETREGLLQQAVYLKQHIESVIPHATPEQTDALFEESAKIMDELLTKLNQQDEVGAVYSSYFDYNEQTDTSSPKPELLAKEQPLKAVGLRYQAAGEGTAFVNMEPNYYLSLFGKRLSPDYYQYLAIRAEENKTPDVMDAGLMISYDDLGKRLVDWENYITTYPNSKWYTPAECHVRRIRTFFLLGIDNTPAFKRNGTPEAETAQAWQNFAQRYPNSPTSAIIQSLQGKLNKKNMEAEVHKLYPIGEGYSCDFSDQYGY